MWYTGAVAATGNDFRLFYQTLFMLTLVPAIVFGMRRGGDFALTAIVVAGSWAVSYFSFGSQSPIWTNAVSDVLSAAFIAMFCTHKAALRVGLIFFASGLLSIVYGVYTHPQTSYGVWYAHVLSVLGHAENLALLIGAADDGIRRRLRSILWPMGAPIRGAGFRRSRVDPETDGS